jgi:hypothetical protein
MILNGFLMFGILDLSRSFADNQPPQTSDWQKQRTVKKAMSCNSEGEFTFTCQVNQFHKKENTQKYHRILWLIVWICPIPTNVLNEMQLVDSWQWAWYVCSLFIQIHVPGSTKNNLLLPIILCFGDIWLFKLTIWLKM